MTVGIKAIEAILENNPHFGQLRGFMDSLNMIREAREVLQAREIGIFARSLYSVPKPPPLQHQMELSATQQRPLKRRGVSTPRPRNSSLSTSSSDYCSPASFLAAMWSEEESDSTSPSLPTTANISAPISRGKRRQHRQRKVPPPEPRTSPLQTPLVSVSDTEQFTGSEGPRSDYVMAEKKKTASLETKISHLGNLKDCSPHAPPSHTHAKNCGNSVPFEPGLINSMSASSEDVKSEIINSEIVFPKAAQPEAHLAAQPPEAPFSPLPSLQSSVRSVSSGLRLMSPLEGPRGPFSNPSPLEGPRGPFSNPSPLEGPRDRSGLRLMSPLEGPRGPFSNPSPLEGPRDRSGLQHRRLRLPHQLQPLQRHQLRLVQLRPPPRLVQPPLLLHPRQLQPPSLQRRLVQLGPQRRLQQPPHQLHHPRRRLQLFHPRRLRQRHRLRLPRRRLQRHSHLVQPSSLQPHLRLVQPLLRLRRPRLVRPLLRLQRCLVLWLPRHRLVLPRLVLRPPSLDQYAQRLRAAAVFRAAGLRTRSAAAAVFRAAGLRTRSAAAAVFCAAGLRTRSAATSHVAGPLN
ncbi:unnamed protein product [Oreochromis niloticus]|nr:unnamed protein product [Mustela putorius furo]